MICGKKFQYCELKNMNLGKQIFLNMCRVCMMTSEYFKENSYELTPTIINMLNSFANVDVSLNDCLPSVICNTCYTRLMESINFKNLCIETNNTLKNYILKIQNDPTEVPQENETETLHPEIKTEEIITNIDEANTIVNDIEFITVKSNVETIEPSQELLNALGLMKVSNSTEEKDDIKCSILKKKKKLYTCKVCNQKLFDYGMHRRHLAAHGECPFSCKICGKRFSRARILKEHIVDEHSGGRPYPCTQCQSKFTSLHELTVHVRKHAGNSKPYACEICPRRFSNSRQLQEHSISHDSPQPSEKYKKTPTGFGNHCCSQCERKFRKRCDLERHERVHSGEKPYTCLICGGRFQQAHNLTKHMVTHTGVRSYTCDICQKTFGRSDVLARHMHVHEISKPHSCQHCSRTFARQSQLVSHVEKRHSKVS